MNIENLIQSDDDLPALPGSVEDIVYHNASNDYYVIEFETEDGKIIMATGIFSDLHKGETLLLFGEWTFHQKYGQQFEVTRFEKTLPQETANILKYLSSGVIKGIGPATAQKIVNRFGTDSFDVIEHHPTWLADIPGISRKKAAEITDSFRKQNGLRRLMLCCGDYFGTILITRIYKQWGDSAISVIEENPYRLCDEIQGIGFEKADTIAQKLGVSSESEFRILSALKYVLNSSAQNSGHVCLPRKKVLELTSAQLGVSGEQINKEIDNAVRNKKLAEYHYEGKEYIYTVQSADAEQFIVDRLLELDRSCQVYRTDDIVNLISLAEAECGMQYAGLQREAIGRSLERGIMILTGGPGTGKTTIVKALINIFGQLGISYALTAPTGRAAKRMSEATGCEAKTIHRLLEAEKSIDGQIHFRKNKSSPLEQKAIIIDEASMIDQPLLDALLHAIIRGTRVIFIGDDNQLPSVGCGNILHDLIRSGVFSTVCLTEIFRQAEQSMIVVNAHRINNGELPLLHVKNEDSFFMARSDDDQIVDTIISLLTTRLPRAYGSDVLEKIQIITPSRKGKAGTENLNKLLKNYLNPKSAGKHELIFRDVVFREGDKVMQIRNNYDIEWTKQDAKGQGVFNGDIGVIEHINNDDETLEIRYDDRLAFYEFQMLEEVEHSYAITVHKSQGSEYPIVIIPLYGCAPMLRTRNLFYTALTRARQMVIMVGSEDIAKSMVENNKETFRYTCLAHRLIRFHDRLK